MKHSGAAIIGILLLPALVLAHESPIDHVDRVVQIYIEGGRLRVIYQCRCQERQALLQLGAMDTDQNGEISDVERDAYFGAIAAGLTKQLRVEIDGIPLPLTIDRPVQLSPDLIQTYELSAPAGALSVGSHSGRFADDYSRAHPGPYRWRPRQINRNGIDVDAVAAPGLENIGPHPAMIVVNLAIKVHPTPTTAPSTPPVP